LLFFSLGCIVSKNSIKRVIKKKNPAIESTANVKENGSFFNKHQQTLANAKSGTLSQDQSKEQTASQKCTKVIAYLKCYYTMHFLTV
jgi:hypothetical protein